VPDVRAESQPVTVGAIALWGSSDLPGLGDQIVPRVLERELTLRLPGWRVAHYAPLGWSRPSVADGGLVAEPLGEFTPRRRQELDEAVHFTVRCQTFPRGTDLAPLYGTRAAEPFYALDLPTVPNVAILADALVPAGVLAARAQQLRQLGVLPAGPYAVGPDGVDITADVVVEDKLAMIAAADGVTTDDEYVAAVATAFGTPVRGPRVTVTAEQARARIDELADQAQAALAERGGDLVRRMADLAAENQALRHAHARLRQRLLRERQILIDQLMDVPDDTETVAALRAELDHERELHRAALARAAEDHRELDALRQTKILRWSESLRNTYGKIKRP
jgi:hypothetical protein